MISLSNEIMYTARKARALANKNRVKIAEDVISKRIQQNKDLSELFEWISQIIEKEISHGSFKAFWYQKEMYKLFPFTETSSEWYILIQQLGYEISGSYSASPENERYFIKF